MRAPPLRVGDEVSRRRVATVTVGVAGATWVAVTGLMARSESAAAAVPIGCPFKAVTGLDCPGCGSTRSLGALTRFDLGAALDHNLLVPAALVFLVASFVVWTAASWRRSEPDREQPGEEFAATDLVRRPVVIVAIGVVVLAFSVVRNLDAGGWLGSGLSG